MRLTPDLARIDRLNKRIKRLRAQGRFEAALPLGDQMLATARRIRARNGRLYTACLTVVARLYVGAGRYGHAVPLLEEALPRYEKHYGPTHLRVGGAWSELGEAYRQAGRLQRAREAYARALAIYRKRKGDDSFHVATVRNNQGLVAALSGHFARAERLYRLALALYEKHLGPTHPSVATVLHNLGALLEDKQDDLGAIHLYQRALQIYTARFGRHNRKVATTLSHLAALYGRVRPLAVAERFYQQVLRLHRRVYGATHPATAQVIDGLGALYANHGLPARALPLIRKALSIRRRVLGEHHLEVARGMNNLAVVLDQLNRRREAAPLYEKALRILGRRLGTRHPLYAQGLSNRGTSRADRGRWDGAWRDLKHAMSIRLANGRTFLPLLPKGARIRHLHLAGLVADHQALLTLALRRAKGRAARAAAGFEISLQFADLLTATLRRDRELGLAHASPRFARLLGARNLALRQLSQRLLAGGAGAEYREGLERLSEAVKRAEAKLVEASGGRLAPPGLIRAAEIGAALGPREALLFFLRFRPRHYGTYGQGAWDDARYAAFVVRSARGARARLFDLGPARDIDGAVRAYLTALGRSPAVAYQRGRPYAQRFLSRRAEALGRRLLGPLSAALRRVRQVYVVPAGRLGRIPFSELPMPGTRRTLGARTGVSILDAPGDLLRLGAGWKRRVRAMPRAAGAPDAVALVAPRYGGPKGSGRGRGTAGRFRSLSWAPKDTTRLRRLLGRAAARSPRVEGRARVQLFTGRDATEARLRSVASPVLLHLYAHGLYLPVGAVTGPARAQGALGGQGGQGALGVSRLEAPADVMLRLDPMFRAAVALAGANRGLEATWRRGPAPDFKRRPDDGLLTAAEAGVLDLSGTELVVIAACESGVGDAADTGFGIFGLRRALLQAGARTLLVSLWKVPEAPTRTLIQAFYRQLAAGATKLQALRRARAAVRRTHPLPYFWAGFVLVGHPGHL